MIDDFMNNLILLPGLVESEDFEIVSDSQFSLLFKFFGGTDVRRATVPVVATQEMLEQEMIEQQPQLDFKDAFVKRKDVSLSKVIIEVDDN